MVKIKSISILLFLGFITSYCKKKEIISNPGYCIGIIYNWGNSSRHLSEINFQYYVNGKGFDTQYEDTSNGWTVPESGAYKSGDMYMVQYSETNLKEARMLFDYPVKDSTDYLNYVIQFKTHPPS